jgi:hypothetical protein
MFKIKKRAENQSRPSSTTSSRLFGFDAPGNVTACAMTLPEDLAAHAKVLSESYDVPPDTMSQLLTEGGTYVYPQEGGILTRGLFACVRDGGHAIPKQNICPGRGAVRGGRASGACSVAPTSGLLHGTCSIGRCLTN